MEKSFHVKVITPEKTLYDGDVFSLVAPAKLGYLGILANHAPLIAAMKLGEIIIRDTSGEPVIIFNKAGGLLEVLNNNATLLVDG